MNPFPDRRQYDFEVRPHDRRRNDEEPLRTVDGANIVQQLANLNLRVGDLADILRSIDSRVEKVGDRVWENTRSIEKMDDRVEDLEKIVTVTKKFTPTVLKALLAVGAAIGGGKLGGVI